MREDNRCYAGGSSIAKYSKTKSTQSHLEYCKSMCNDFRSCDLIDFRRDGTYCSLWTGKPKESQFCDRKKWSVYKREGHDEGKRFAVKSTNGKFMSIDKDSNGQETAITGKEIVGESE